VKNILLKLMTGNNRERVISGKG